LSYYLVCFRCLYDEIKMYIMVHTKFRSEETWRDFNKKDSADFRSEFLMGYLRVICVAYKQNMRLFFQKFWLTKSSQKFAPVI